MVDTSRISRSRWELQGLLQIGCAEQEAEEMVMVNSATNLMGSGALVGGGMAPAPTLGFLNHFPLL